ncbi:hypothetical protein EHI42_02470 [Rhizobium hidalgonense]|uniref:hypothetical protein n=1 Tax=Rhizobium hidalgonense TaxID=1538159 RepID=UPI000FEC2874|nr:hypothetical protein [Rhizobium hidalgonense]RWX20057.1 hypothetical protein EHI42_02470 [Rhizobium hidalgonense]
MNRYYSEFISTAKALAAENGLTWELAFDERGKVSRETRWNLTSLVGMLPPPVVWLGQVGVEANSFTKVNEIRRRMNQSLIVPSPMNRSWRDLYQAIFVYQLLVQKNKPHSAGKMALPVRQLAPVAGDTPPWAVTPEQIKLAYNATLECQGSGKVSLDFKMMVRTILEAERVADIPALSRFCLPYNTDEALAAEERAQTIRARQNAQGSQSRTGQRLFERKAAEKLPDERAFWELARIVFTENPKDFSDVIRFAAYAVQIMLGLRIGEVAALPVDWKRWVDHVDGDGRPAGERGGVSRSLRIRYFAEKQEEDERSNGLALYEETRDVPQMFEAILVEMLDKVERLTAPLRTRLKMQSETGRIFPEHSEQDLVPAWEMRLRMTGKALFSDADVPQPMIDEYRITYDPTILHQIRMIQLEGRRWELAKFWHAQKDVPIRDKSGEPIVGNISWKKAYVRVGDVESHIRKNTPSKLSDTKPTQLTSGAVFYPHELLFITPKRNLAEGRDNDILDVTMYSSINRVDPNYLLLRLTGTNPTIPTLFARYGETEEARALTMLSHSLRHLLNTELFRLGVADAMITKMFGRRSVQQSHVYNHMSLYEDMKDADVPPEAEDAMGEKALQVYKMIKVNKVRGPVVDEFRRVQREYGDDAAFDYLNAEADGLHATPYGLCLNSFTGDPCPKHLECFNGCLHLARTPIASEQEHLERLRDRFAKIIIQLEQVPENRRYVGWANQIAHARVRYDNIVKALEAEPGTQVFPDGKDFSFTPKEAFGNTIIDTMNRVDEIND